MHQITYLAADGTLYYLRGTVWTSIPERADTYPDKAAADAAFAKATKFMAPAVRKAAKFVAL